MTLLNRLGVLSLAVSLSAGLGAAQSPDPELIQRLIDRITQLERRVAELEAERNTAALPPAVLAPAAPPAAPAVQAQTQSSMPGMAMPTPVSGEASRPI